jgi:hypothetical protein
MAGSKEVLGVFGRDSLYLPIAAFGGPFATLLMYKTFGRLDSARPRFVFMSVTMSALIYMSLAVVVNGPMLHIFWFYAAMLCLLYFYIHTFYETASDARMAMDSGRPEHSGG